MAIYLKKFDNHSQYEAFTATTEFILPNVSYCVQEDDVHYNPSEEPHHDYSQDYLTFTALENGTFRLSGNSVSYSLDDGATWTTLASDTNSPTVNSGNKIILKGELVPQSSKGIGRFSSTGKFEAQGNPMSLRYGDDFKGQTSLEENYYTFYGLFSGCTKLESAENLSLPATTLSNGCYGSMFYGCTSLTAAPILSATTLAESCYGHMFDSCTSCTTAPELPATTLAFSCYDYMFKGCTSLTTTPELPATTLANYCYQYMFNGCTSLTTALELPATRLADYCYRYMFSGCTSLTTAPTICATTMAANACTSMFNGCTSLTTAPELSATTLASYCYRYMFSGCTSLNYIKCLATNKSAINCTQNWVSSVASTGTFVKAASMTSWPSGDSGIPNDWTVQDVS